MPEPRMPNDVTPREHLAYRRIPWGKWLSILTIGFTLIGGGAWLMSACNTHEGRHTEVEVKIDRLEKLEGTVRQMNKLLIRMSERMGIEE